MLALLVRIPVSCLTKLLVQFSTEQNYRVTQLNLYRLGTNENKQPFCPGDSHEGSKPKCASPLSVGSLHANVFYVYHLQSK